MSRDWFKVRRGWHDSPSHRSLSGDALQLGPGTLFYLADANWEPGQLDAPLLDAGDGHPLTASEIAAAARWPVARTRKALADLVRVGTLVEREGGGWSFPNYGVHQETPAARRMREKRARDEDVKRATNSAVTDMNTERNSDGNSYLSTSTSTSTSGVNPGGGSRGEAEMPRVVIVGRTGDADAQLAARIAEAAQLAHVDHRAARGLFAAVVERTEHGTPLDEVLAVLRARRRDTESGAPDMVRMLWTKFWPDTQARYLGVNGKRAGPRLSPVEIAERKAREAAETRETAE